MNCETYQDLVAAHVDDVLSAEEKREAAHHLAACPRCQQLFTDQSRFHAAFLTRQLIVPVPIAVEERLRMALDATGTLRTSWRTRILAFLSPPRLVFGLVAAGLLIALFIPRLFFRASEPTWVIQSVDTYQTATEGRLSFTYQTENPQELTAAFNNSRQLDFVTHVLDLRSAGYRIVGGYVLQQQGHPIAVVLYKGNEGSIVCLRQRGTAPPMPTGGDGTQGQYFYTQAGYTFSLVQFPDHFCTLITRLPREVFQQQLRTATLG